MNRKHGLRKHPLYSIWRNVKTRLYNHKTHNYINYGGKGVNMCDEWRNDINEFYKWSISNGYRAGLTLDRINPDGDYRPDNCRWTTTIIQARNKSKYRNTKNTYAGIRKVRWSNKDKYTAGIRVYGKQIHLGSFNDERSAIEVRNNYILNNNLEGYNIISI